MNILKLSAWQIALSHSPVQHKSQFWLGCWASAPTPTLYTSNWKKFRRVLPDSTGVNSTRKPDAFSAIRGMSCWFRGAAKTTIGFNKCDCSTSCCCWCIILKVVKSLTQMSFAIWHHSVTCHPTHMNTPRLNPNQPDTRHRKNTSALLHLGIRHFPWTSFRRTIPPTDVSPVFFWQHSTRGVQKVLQLNMMHKWHKRNFYVIIQHDHP